MQLATMAEQGKTKVTEFEDIARRVRDGYSSLVEIDGVVREEKPGAIALAADLIGKRPSSTVIYTSTLLAKSAQIQRASSKFTSNIEVVSDEDPADLAITHDSLDALELYIRGLKGGLIRVRDIETHLSWYILMIENLFLEEFMTEIWFMLAVMPSFIYIAIHLIEYGTSRPEGDINLYLAGVKKSHLFQFMVYGIVVGNVLFFISLKLTGSLWSFVIVNAGLQFGALMSLCKFVKRHAQEILPSVKADE
jgi:hypothetical protein